MFTPVILIFIFLVLILLMSLRNKWIINEPNKVGCSTTEFGCCPDNLTPKLSRQGENCSQKIGVVPPQPYQPPMGGCVGTQYGCCLDGVTPAYDQAHSNCFVKPPPPPSPSPPQPPSPSPPQPQPIGGCAGTRYGCCPNGVTPSYDQYGSNCLTYNQQMVGGCSGTQYGCCGDGITPADQYHSNCLNK